MTSKLEFALGLGFILLAGCPQLLDDDFSSRAFDAGSVQTQPDTSVELGGSGGSNVGGSGAGGANVGAPNAPVVVSVVPADGARGVLPDAELVFSFSRSMDTSSVEDAYLSSELPAAQVAFTWSDGDTVLRVRPNSGLVVATGSDPATVAAASYTVDLTSRARDKAGNALVPEHVRFTAVRSITQQLDAVRDRNLTGNWSADGTYGLNYCQRADTTICMGDGAATYKAFVTFELASVPVDLVSLVAAELNSTVLNIYGAPFSALGALEIEHAEFSIIGNTAFSAPGLAASRSMSTGTVAGGQLSADVLADVQADWGARARSQFRLYFGIDTNSDAVADQVVCDWTSVHLTLSYLAP